jgi:hypothetical protein
MVWVTAASCFGRAGKLLVGRPQDFYRGGLDLERRVANLAGQPAQALGHAVEVLTQQVQVLVGGLPDLIDLEPEVQPAARYFLHEVDVPGDVLLQPGAAQLLGFEHGLQAVGHPVERGRQTPDLVTGRDLHALIQLAARHLLGDAGQRAQRPGDPPRDDQCHQQPGCEGHANHQPDDSLR